MKFLILFIAVFLPSLNANWCGLESCSGRQHIHCVMVDEQFSPACYDNAQMLNLENAKEAILDKHNTYRNQIAGGLLANKFAAVRMGTMKWNVTFANLARRNVKKCNFEPDECMNTPDFDFVGQNIARSVVPVTDTRTNYDIIMGLIDLWFSEHTSATMANIRSLPHPGSGPTIANFTQMVRDYSTRVGCAALRYFEGSNKIILFTCNYDLANMVDWPVYVDGSTAKNCKTGRNPTYTNLCSVDEKYNVNNFWEDF